MAALFCLAHRLDCGSKTVNTIPIVKHYVRDYLIERFGEQIAEDIKPLEVQKWLKSLNEANGLAWTRVAKIRGIMLRIYKIGVRHEHVSKIRSSAWKRENAASALGQHGTERALPYLRQVASAPATTDDLKSLHVWALEACHRLERRLTPQHNRGN